ncbi:MAG TPA: alpha/beta hydrolase [Stellaceae bacterium]|nr:alpha/beta hydrolase [Stellaceae bacterium]
MAAPLALKAGYSPIAVVNALTPRDSYSLTPSVPYTMGARGTLDVYLPMHQRPDRPIVVFFYGGGWETGDKTDYRFIGEAFAAHGYVTVIPDYRLYPEVVYPGFLEDNAAAVAWVDHHRAELGDARGPIYLIGHSAGAYGALMLTLDKRWLAAASGVSGGGTDGGRAPDRLIKATIGLAGPYDFLPVTSPTLQTIFGPEATRPDTQPIRHVRGDAPPVLLATGDLDTMVSPANATRLAAAIRATGGTAETINYDGITHSTLVGALADPFRFLAPVLKDCLAFLEAHR